MFYDDEIKFSSCFPPKTGITNWLKALIKQKHKYKQIKTLKDIFYDLPRYERSGLRERFEMKSGINDYVSFLTVRHPFSRILSAYRNWHHSSFSVCDGFCDTRCATVATLLSTSDGYINVGDGCWRPNVLVTSLRCW